MKKKKQYYKNKAFTLIEILLAIVILEIGLLGISSFYAYSLNIAKVARNETTAANLAQGLLDEQSAVSFDNLAVGAGAKTAYSSDVASPFANFQKQIDVAYIDMNLATSYVATEDNQNMKKITVTVFWPQDSTEKNFQIATIKANH
ncbi:MAG: prepilin-type N-terminal cleavage/methylation domain-containing protein [Patescibacteria group bacterium]|jgi:type IV pilus assembly protein PilV